MRRAARSRSSDVAAAETRRGSGSVLPFQSSSRAADPPDGSRRARRGTQTRDRQVEPDDDVRRAEHEVAELAAVRRRRSPSRRSARTGSTVARELVVGRLDPVSGRATSASSSTNGTSSRSRRPCASVVFPFPLALADHATFVAGDRARRSTSLGGACCSGTSATSRRPSLAGSSLRRYLVLANSVRVSKPRPPSQRRLPANLPSAAVRASARPRVTSLGRLDADEVEAARDHLLRRARTGRGGTPAPARRARGTRGRSGGSRRRAGSRTPAGAAARGGRPPRARSPGSR